MRRFVTLFFTVFILSGCAAHSIPPYSEGQTLLVIPKSNENNSLESWFREYYVVLESLDKDPDFKSLKIWLDNNDEPYVVVDSIPEGAYAITNIKWKVNRGWRGTKAMGEGYKVSLPVNVVKGQITVPLYRFMVKQESRGSMAYSSINYENLQSTALNEIKDSIAELDNGLRWAKDLHQNNLVAASHCGSDAESKTSRREYNAYIQKALNRIISNLDAPTQDGNSYHGEINLKVGVDGHIEEFVLNRPSGHSGLDSSFMDAVKKTEKLEMPDNRCALELFAKAPLILIFDETDMEK